MLTQKALLLSPQPVSWAVFAFTTLPFISGLTLVNVDSQVRYQAFRPDNLPKFAQLTWHAHETAQVDWLIYQFNQWFSQKNTVLVRGEHEPEYLAATANAPAKIVFAHGFFASCLHEISHWCVAGKQRRQLDDFGYWYAPDGRNAEQQRNFEKVEIVPQAIECLLTLSCGKKFRVSQDNLFADFDTSQSTFAKDVRTQALHFWQTGEKLPSDAKILLKKLAILRPLPLTSAEIAKNFVDV